MSSILLYKEGTETDQHNGLALDQRFRDLKNARYDTRIKQLQNDIESCNKRISAKQKEVTTAFTASAAATFDIPALAATAATSSDLFIMSNLIVNNVIIVGI